MTKKNKLKTISLVALALAFESAMPTYGMDLHAREISPSPTQPNVADVRTDEKPPIPFSTPGMSAYSMYFMKNEIMQLQQTVIELRAEIRELKSVVASLFDDIGDEEGNPKEFPIFSRCPSHAGSSAAQSRTGSLSNTMQEKPLYTSLASVSSQATRGFDLLPTTPPLQTIGEARGRVVHISNSNNDKMTPSDNLYPVSSSTSDDEGFNLDKRRKEKQQRLSKKAKRLEHFRQMASEYEARHDSE